MPAESIDPVAECARLHLCDAPLLIGVRHHSAMLARAMGSILDRFSPQRILIEMPSDLSDWMVHIADPLTQPPIAISAVGSDGNMMFYPLAEFSPEFVAIRWAFANQVPVKACDLSVSAKYAVEFDTAESSSDLLQSIMQRTGANDVGDLWQRMVESPGCDADPETIRRAALTFGWAVRSDSHRISPRDLVREAAMRQAIRETDQRTAAIVGSYHAAALLPERVHETEHSDPTLLATVDANPESVGVSLIPYSFEQLDERSGYPAGILDPQWHQRMVQSESNSEMDQAAVELATGVCRQLRRAGHVAGTPDASETIRMMRDLARLRGLGVAGRGELVEALQSCLVHGDVMGRGRAVSIAAAQVLVGDQTGVVTPAAPRCGLAVSIDQLFEQLGLPGRDSLGKANKRPESARWRAGLSPDDKELRLDVLRSPKDRARAVVLRRLDAAGIPYARRLDTVEQGLRENLIERWSVQWLQSTSATIESVSRFGVTLDQASEQILRSGNTADTEQLPTKILERLRIASECGLQQLTNQTLAQLDQTFQHSASLSDLVQATSLIVRIAASHLPGLPLDPADAAPPIVPVYHLPDAIVSPAKLLHACLLRLGGLRGSSDRNDAIAVAELVDWFTGDLYQTFLGSNADVDHADDDPVTPQHLINWCKQTLRDGSNLMRGVSAGGLCVLGEMDSKTLGGLLTGWIDSASDRSGRERLRDGLSGCVQLLLSRMQNDAQWLDGFEATVNELDDADFLTQLPALRGGFQPFSPADRQRVLDIRFQGLDDRRSSIEESSDDPSQQQVVIQQVARLRHCDLAGQRAVEALFPELQSMLEQPVSDRSKTSANADSSSELDTVIRPVANGQITTADRWRLILGLPPESPQSRVQSAARSLDQMFGRGRGEGSRREFAERRGSTGGQEAPSPSSAQWADDLEALFGSDVCQEVLGTAAAAGNPTLIQHLDPDSVTPSVDLLQQVLSLAGAMPESRMHQLRRLAKRITDQLAQQLAVRLQTALSGLSTPRPTRRRSRQLNLPRTIRENLRNCRRRPDGRATIIADRLIFNAPARREMDWHVTFVVDVSGSMSASVVYSALVAAIFDALPALSVRFLAFSTELIDLSDQVADPLALLLEVDVGGGTDIGLGLRAARAGIKVPSRSIVVLVTDFEEGVSIPSMLAEVRALVDSGVRCLGLASLDDSGQARYHDGLAQMMASAGMSVAAVSPEKLARWIGDQIRGNPSSGQIDG
ncbi:DUF5682 family protein [Stieleria sp. TO1_6]|uniref:DUF5682 family protein n=1 Tax=Stieleria tagensis TaxID=2956795 RepID=UPI00209B0654|nr:DUF5682 family protein [Stieleria tagensis]MCO8121993.1 DUF5682 family protein [Stieleria tagensis]